MIPSANKILLTTLNVKKQPSKDYKLHIEQNTISGVCDGLEAMKQVIYKILSTERYQYIMYSWDYGIELLDLFGEPITYVLPEIKRRITEALVQDDRIRSVDGFEFDVKSKGTVSAKFTVHTIFGDVQEEKVVNF
jgi:phage baseplate assembly protein W